jgi:hypothetical protein
MYYLDKLVDRSIIVLLLLSLVFISIFITVNYYYIRRKRKDFKFDYYVIKNFDTQLLPSLNLFKRIFLNYLLIGIGIILIIFIIIYIVVTHRF